VVNEKLGQRPKVASAALIDGMSLRAIDEARLHGLALVGREVAVVCPQAIDDEDDRTSEPRYGEGAGGMREVVGNRKHQRAVPDRFKNRIVDNECPGLLAPSSG
jgi:hypothetical protein